MVEGSDASGEKPGELPSTADAAAATLTTDGLAAYYRNLVYDDPREKVAATNFGSTEELVSQSNYDDAVRSAKSTVSLFREVGNETGAADALRLLIHAYRLKAEILRSSNEVDAARDLIKKAESTADQEKEYFHQAGNKRGEAAMLIALAEVNFQKRGVKKRDQALQSALQALGLCLEAGDRRLEARVQLVLSHIHVKKGPAQAALQAATGALALFKGVGDQLGEAQALSTLALGYQCCRRAEGGIQLAQQALAIYKQKQMKSEQALLLYIIARMSFSSRQVQAALEAARKSQDLFQETNYGKGWLSVTNSLVAQLELDKDSVKSQAPIIPSPAKQAPAKTKMPQASAEQKEQEQEPDEHLTAAYEQRALFRRIPQVSTDEKAMIVKPGQKALRETVQQAIEVAKEAEAAFKEEQNWRDESAALLVVAEGHRLNGNYHAAARNAIKSQARARDAAEKGAEWQSSCFLTHLHMTNDRAKEAVRTAKEAVRASKFMDPTVQVDTALLLVHASFDELLQVAEASQAVRHTLTMRGETALNHAGEAVVLAKQLGDKSRIASALLLSGQVAYSIQRPDIASSASSEAQQLFAEVKDASGEAAALTLEAQVHVANGRLSEAHQSALRAKSLASSSAERLLEQYVSRLVEDTAPTPEEEEELVAAETQVQVRVARSPSSVAKAAPEPEEVGLSLEVVRGMVMNVGREIMSEFEDDLVMDVALMDVGLDSLSALSFRNQLNVETGIRLPGTVMFDYPTMSAVAQFITDLSKDG